MNFVLSTDYISRFAKMRNVGLALLSLSLTSVVIGNAYYQKKQFYPSVVYITKSNPSMAVIYLQALIFVVFLGKLMRKLFFGELRAAEFEHLVERSWYAITETCLAFTVFKDDFSPKFVALFTLLLFLKSFHWLTEDRVDFMERSPTISWLFHIRIVSLLTLLANLDMYFVYMAYFSTIEKGPSVQLVFGFEYAILLTTVFNIVMKYVLHTVDIQREIFWENKAVFLLYMELVIGMLRVSLYVMFVCLMIRLYTLPLFAFRPLYYSVRNFKKALHDVIMSRRAIRNMNTLYPDATPEELASGDNVCIICREEMRINTKKLPCNHIFHTSCLRSWFQRHQTCPTCRHNILRPLSAVNNAEARYRQPPAAPGPAQMPAPNQQRNQQQIPPFHLMWQRLFPANAAAGDQNRDQTRNNNQQTSSSQQTQPNLTQGFQPPPMFPYSHGGFPVPPMSLNPMMTPPPPLPPEDWSGLSDDELRRMEGAARASVETRLRCLQNIQRMINATDVLMQQYLTSTGMINAAAAAAATPFSGTSTQPTTSTSTSASFGHSAPGPSGISSTTPSSSNIDTPENVTPGTSATSADSETPSTSSQSKR